MTSNGDVNAPNQAARSVDKPQGGKKRFNVSLLDDTVVGFDVEPRATGEVLFKKVRDHLNLDEAEYFGLQYVSDSNLYWLDAMRPISKQMKIMKGKNRPQNEITKEQFKFRVMFYTPEPNHLQEYTRYLFTLQVRRDLLDGRLECLPDTGALLASYIVQGELGDYDPANHKDGYLSGFQFVPNQTPDVENSIVNYHKSHRGLSPAEADHNMLEIARKLETYGITRYPVLDKSNVEINIAVHDMGILVFQKEHRINSFSWANIRKLSFKKREFLIKLHAGAQHDKDIVVFTMSGRDACKNFWKVVVSHHVFFRHKNAQSVKSTRSSLRKGSKFRYSGRTRQEMAAIQGQVSAIPNDTDRFPLGSQANDFDVNASNDVEAQVTAADTDTASRKSSKSDGLDEEIPTYPPPEYSQAVAAQALHMHNETDGIGSSTKISITSQESLDNGSYYLSKEEKDQSLSGSIQKIKLDTDDEDCDSALNYKMNEEDKPRPSDQDASNPPTLNNTNLSSSSFSELEPSLRVSGTDKELHHEMSSIFKNFGINNTDEEHLIQTNESTEADLPQIVSTNTRKALEPKDMLHNSEDETSDISHRTEADEETESQLMQKVKDLYLQSTFNTMSSTSTYDSDSDASAIGVDDEENCFDDEFPSPNISKSSSLSSIKSREEYLDSFKKIKAEKVQSRTVRNLTSNSSSQSSISSAALLSSSRVYYLAKEILLTERTYVKDLEVLTVSFRTLVEKENLLPADLEKLLYDNIDPLYDFHCSLLAELEERIVNWESTHTTEASRDCIQKIGDIMHRNMRQFKIYSRYIRKHGDIMLCLDGLAKRSAAFDEAYKEFEMSKGCYLSLNAFLLKPTQRLLYYRDSLEQLLKQYGEDNNDYVDTMLAHNEVMQACKDTETSIENLENLHRLIELERDLVGVEDIVHSSRKFIREGCLHKVCRKGPQPRMFFLMSDVLIYTTQGQTLSNKFRVRAQCPLRVTKVEEGGVELHGLYSFTITCAGSRSFVVAASSPEEKMAWIQDLQAAIDNAVKESYCPICQANKTEFMLLVGRDLKSLCDKCKHEVHNLEGMPPDQRLNYWQCQFPPPPKLKKSSEDEGSFEHSKPEQLIDPKASLSKAISTRRICWHRNTSISMKEYISSIKSCLSGELLRKFKNTNKWQRLWVVFTNFSMYFFKSHEDDSPLASLPLIGYTLSKVSEIESHDDFTFKLQFKTHIYIFKTENEFSFERWMNVVGAATKTVSHARLLHRMHSSKTSLNE